VDRHLRRTQTRTDLSELAQQAVAESLSALCRATAETAFGASLETVQQALYALSTKKGFATLAEDFFARLTRRFLLYHLSRELSNHVGYGRRFASVDDHNEFLRGLERHCRSCARSVHRFAGGWYDKGNWQGGTTQRKARGFAAHALDKMNYALRQKGVGRGA
jgi:hypothetical protein